MSKYYTQGLILKHQDWQAADRLLTVYTKEYGKIKIIAKGTKKITSKLAGSLEPFIRADLMVVKGQGFDKAVGLEIIQNFSGLKKDLKKIALATYIAELVDSTTKDHQPDERVFQLLSEVFLHLDKNSSNNNYPAVIWYFIWRYLSRLGYQPELYKCRICGSKIILGQNYFDLKKGGVVCHDCQIKQADLVKTSNNLIKVLRVVMEGDIVSLKKIKLNRTLIAEVNNLTKAYLNFTQEKELPLVDFLKTA